MKFLLKKLKLLDYIIFSGFLVFGFIFIFINRFGGNEPQLVLVVDSERVNIPWKDAILDLKHDYGKNILIEVEGKRARVIESDCPDKICVSAGWIAGCGQTAACLPNKTAIIISCDVGD